jgi:hypothetical protein
MKNGVECQEESTTRYGGVLLIRSGVNKARSFKGHVEGITGRALPVNSNRGYLAKMCHF